MNSILSSVFILFLLFSYSTKAIIPTICIDPEPPIIKKITRYHYNKGICNKIVYLAVEPPYTYFDTEEECTRRCVNSNKD